MRTYYFFSKFVASLALGLTVGFIAALIFGAGIAALYFAIA